MLLAFWPVSAQVEGLTTNADGSVLYFSTSLRQTARRVPISGIIQRFTGGAKQAAWNYLRNGNGSLTATE